MSVRLSALGERLSMREQALTEFLDREQDRLARACHDMARAFSQGGKLVPYGQGAAATDAAHLAVEFMHPVIVGKRALPAVAPTNDPTGAAPAGVVAPGDVAVGLAHRADDPAVADFLADAARAGAVTMAMTGPGAPPRCDYVFAVPSDDPAVVQEVHETAYHELWELVHVFFEHPGLLADACITCGDVAVEARVVEVRGATAVIEKGGAREEVAIELVEDVSPGDFVLCHAGVALEKAPGEVGDDPSGFLYPFLGREEGDLDSVLADVRASIVQKGRDVVELRRGIDLDAIERCAVDLRRRLDRGGRVIAFGNGGSSTDAQDLAADCAARGLPAIALTNDVATVTAVGNDVGFENVFARQLIPLARTPDAAVAISTSGSSPNVVAGLEEAHRRGMLTIAITGYDGGRLAELDWLDHLFIARSDYVPRLQEAHATIYHLLLEALG